MPHLLLADDLLTQIALMVAAQHHRLAPVPKLA
jgi:hypothetical protein